MKIHKNARLTFARRLELVRAVADRKMPLHDAAARHGVTVATARKWVRRYLAQGETGLHDRTSRPYRSPRTPEEIALRILELRRARLSMKAIAAQAGCSVSTVSRICAQAGLSRLTK